MNNEESIRADERRKISQLLCENIIPTLYENNVDKETINTCKRLFKQMKDEVSSHSELDILKECINLMHELVDDFAEWYKYVHGENAIAELEYEERFRVRKSYFSIVQQLFLCNTKHSGGGSTCAKCHELGIKDWSEDIEFGFEVEEDEDI